MNAIGCKDINGNNVVFITRNKPIKKSFWDEYKLKELSFNAGDSMARMVVEMLK